MSKMLSCLKPSVAQDLTVVELNPERGDATSIHAELFPYLKQYGSTIMAYSTLQKGLRYFMIRDMGYIAYAVRFVGPPFLLMREPLVLGDPVCHPKDRLTLLAAFLRKYSKAIFLQASKDTAQVLQGLEMTVNSMGGETELDLATYQFSGNAKRGLRSAMSAAQKDGVKVEELAKLTPQLIAEMKEVDKAWVDARGEHAGSVWFINRLPVFADEEGVRKLAARDHLGRMLAFVACDPVYEAGQVIGYYANVTRMRPDAHAGTLNLMMSWFIEKLRAEGSLNGPTKKLSEKKSLKKKKAEQAAAAALAAAAGAAAQEQKPPAAKVVKESAGDAATHKRAPAASAKAAAQKYAPADALCILADSVFEDTTPPLELQSGLAADGKVTSTPAHAADKQKQQAKTDQQLRPQQHQQQKGQKADKDQEEPQQQQKAAVRFVSLGLSPFHQLKDGEMNHSKSVAKWLNRAFEHGNPFYPYKTIAASKAKYGAGLHDGVYKDSNVTYRNTYLCHTHGRQAAVTLYDLGAFVGFYYYPIPAMITMLKAKRQQEKERAAASRSSSRQLSALSEFAQSEMSEIDSSMCMASAKSAGALGAQGSRASSAGMDESDDVSSSSSGPAPVKAKLVVPRAKIEGTKELTKCYSPLIAPEVIKADASYSRSAAPQVVEIV